MSLFAVDANKSKKRRKRKMDITRTKWDIIHDVLSAIAEKDGIAKTQMGYKANLTHKETIKYLRLMESHGFAKTEKDYSSAQTITRCTITSAGLAMYDKIQAVYDCFGGKRPIW